MLVQHYSKMKDVRTPRRLGGRGGGGSREAGQGNCEYIGLSEKSLREEIRRVGEKAQRIRRFLKVEIEGRYKRRQ